MSNTLRYVLFVLAAIILLVLLPMARGCIEPHAVHTVGPPELELPAEPMVPVLDPARGPGTGAKAGADPAASLSGAKVFSARAKEMPPAHFNHRQHASQEQLNIACADCHHPVNGSANTMPCSMCHREAHSAEMWSIKAAQHKSCIGCHLAANANDAGMRSAPVDCEGCHIP
jgi:predicted CXXCH cytochrome family protein